MGKLAVKRKVTRENTETLAHSLFLTNMIKNIEEKGLTSKEIAVESELDQALIEKLIKGELRPSRSILHSLSLAPCVGITYKTLVTWCLLDDSLRYASAHRIGI